MKRFRSGHFHFYRILLPGLILLHLSSANSWAGHGTEGSAFLAIPVGARPAAMGGAYSALATDAYAPVWNPGAMPFSDSTQLAGQHLSYLESIHYESFSFVHPWKRQALGFAAQYLGSGDIPGRNDIGTLTSEYSSHYAAYSLSYGIHVTDKLGIGLTGKLIEAKLSDVSANAYAGDLGALYRMTDQLSLAAVMTNGGSSLKFIDQNDPLPLAFKLAAAYEPVRRLTLALEGDFHKESPPHAHLGVEWKPLSMIALRAGYRTDTVKELSPVAGMTAGIGIMIWGQELAYAWLPYGDLGSTHYFSLTLRFGQPTDDSRNLALSARPAEERP